LAVGADEGLPLPPPPAPHPVARSLEAAAHLLGGGIAVGVVAVEFAIGTDDAQASFQRLIAISPYLLARDRAGGSRAYDGPRRSTI
jgi:hypothetical protein